MSSDRFELYKSLGPLIRDYRQWHGMSQERLAESIGVSVRELRRWEANRGRARIENLHDISEVSGIPMQVCIALNADQPVWYSLWKRRFAYSSMEIAQYRISDLVKCREQSDERVFAKIDRITTAKHINMIHSYNRDICHTNRPLRRDVIKAASTILPDLNLISFDCWGHYVGHTVCLPIKKDAYQREKEKISEGYLTTETMSDILSHHEGVFFFYSLFAANAITAQRLIAECERYLAKIEHKEGYLMACYGATKELKQIFNDLGMRIVFRNAKDYGHTHSEVYPEVYEIKLGVNMKRLRRFAASGFPR